jgi:hypothetical protein
VAELANQLGVLVEDPLRRVGKTCLVRKPDALHGLNLLYEINHLGLFLRGQSSDLVDDLVGFHGNEVITGGETGKRRVGPFRRMAARGDLEELA